jgi:hypothetical protein
MRLLRRAELKAAQSAYQLQHASMLAARAEDVE